MLYAESLNYKNNPNGRIGGLIEKRGEGFNMSKCIVKILRDETPGGLAEKINTELEENTRSWDTVTGIKYQVAVIPIMRGKEIAGFKTEYSALIPG